jgi:hypothetical protein
MKITSFAIIALLLIAVTSNSQTIKQKSVYAKQMTFEIGGDIFVNSTNYTREKTKYNSSINETQQNYIIDVNAGIFVVNGLKLSIEPAIEISSYNDYTMTHLKLYFTPEYVFNLKSVVYPYIGGSVGYTSANYSSPLSSSPSQGGFSWGAKGGMKVNAFGNALINVCVLYYQETYNYTDSYEGDVKMHNNIFGVKAGFSVFFR